MNFESYLSVVIALPIISILLLATIIIKKHLNCQIFKKILSLSIVIIFTMWLLSFTKNDLIDAINLKNSTLAQFGDPYTIISSLLLWFMLASVVLITIEPWFKLHTLTSLTKIFGSVTFLMSICFLPYIHLLQFGDPKVNEVSNYASLTFLTIWVSIGLFYSVFLWFEDPKVRMNKKDILSFSLYLLGALISSFPTWITQLFFGTGNTQLHVQDFAVDHRAFIYVVIIVPIIIYFLFRKKDYQTRYAVLLFIAIATMNTFSYRWSYVDIIQPWNWPLHLCNTAMYLLVVCLVFKTKRLFYFTYFINVFGAFIAMVAPNYSENITILNNEIFYFWINHMCAFGMPLLLVALDIFPRPKMKQMWYSIVGFFLYFITALTLNAVFTGLGHNTDFFFLNGTFIVDKLGNWAQQMFNISLSFTIGGVTLTYNYVYQIVFFLVYVGIAFSMWYIYSLFFDLSEKHKILTARLHKIKLDELALNSQLNGRSIEKPMKENTGVILELENFSKVYGNSNKYAVHDANLKVYGGEIFGFLGPNGAGKSTTIKSIVGIQTITSGHIYLCGYDISSQPVESKKIIGYVPDHYALYENLTGREYINYIADIYDVKTDVRNERISKYVTILHLNESFDSAMRTYSHGMKQKIAIIAALVHNPKLWILDEPLTGLDPDSIYQVKECMKEHAKEGNIVMFSSHIIDVVENLCSRVVVIKKGHMNNAQTIEEIHKTSTLEDYYLHCTIDEVPADIVNEEKLETKASSIYNKIVKKFKDKKSTKEEKE